MSAGGLRPLSLKREGDGLAVEWSYGVTTFATWRHLRANCPCASCLAERAKPQRRQQPQRPPHRPLLHRSWKTTSV